MFQLTPTLKARRCRSLDVFSPAVWRTAWKQSPYIFLTLLTAAIWTLYGRLITPPLRANVSQNRLCKYIRFVGYHHQNKNRPIWRLHSLTFQAEIASKNQVRSATTTLGHAFKLKLLPFTLNLDAPTGLCRQVVFPTPSIYYNIFITFSYNVQNNKIKKKHYVKIKNDFTYFSLKGRLLLPVVARFYSFLFTTFRKFNLSLHFVLFFKTKQKTWKMLQWLNN